MIATSAALVVSLLASTPQSVSLSISVDSAVVSMGGAFSIDAELHNGGSYPVCLYAKLVWSDGAGFGLEILSEEGQRVFPRYLVDEKVIPQTLESRSSYVVLFRDHFLGTRRTESVADIFPKPGRYSLIVTYLSPVSKRYFPGDVDHLYAREDGILKSNSISIEVLPSP